MPVILVTSAEGDWFKSLTPEMQKQYLEEHPNSKYASGGAHKSETQSDGHGEGGEHHLSHATRQVLRKLPKPVRSFFHKKEYEPNAPFRKKLSAFTHNSVHLLAKTVVEEVGEWKSGVAAIKRLATGTKYKDLTHEQREGLTNTAKFIATVGMTVALGAGLEHGAEGLAELVKGGVATAMGREAMVHLLSKSGANAVIHAAADDDMAVLKDFITKFAQSLKDAPINPEKLANAVHDEHTAKDKEQSNMRVILSKSSNKWSDAVTKNEKFHTPPGLFTQSAQKIATWLLANSDTVGQAVKRIVFYIERAGDNLSSDDKARLEKAKKLIQAKEESNIAVFEF